MADIVASIRALCDVMAAASVTPTEVARAIGDIVEDHGPSLPIHVRPRDEMLTDATVVRAFEADEPSHLALTVAADAEVRLRDLASLGSFEESILAPDGGAPTVILEIDHPGAPCTCAVIVELERAAPGGDRLPDARVATITIRRDERFD